MPPLWDEAVVINLDRRQDRLSIFSRDVQPHLGRVVRYPAIDATRCPPPPWWPATAGAGAWGCYRSHLACIERSLNRDRTILVLEDDAVPAGNLPERLRTLPRPPGPWDMLYLGGQHLRPPDRSTSPWVRARNVNRLHAYVIAPSGAARLYRALTDTATWSTDHEGKHVDHVIGRAHASMDVWAHDPWLFGQAEGASDIMVQGGSDLPRRFWHPADRFPAVAVVGPWGSGTSLVAGVLHHLGVSMGQSFLHIGPDDSVQSNTFEAVVLRRILFDHLREPGREPEWWRLKKPYDSLVDGLRRWIRDRRSFAKKHRDCLGVGGKVPVMCHPTALRAIAEAWDPVVFLRVRRDPGRRRATLERRRWKGIDEAVARQMDSWLDEHLPDDTPTIYSDVLRTSPAEGIDTLTSLLNLSPTPAQRVAALGFIQP